MTFKAEAFYYKEPASGCLCGFFFHIQDMV